MTSATSSPQPAKRVRMTRIQRREQLIEIGRALFAAHGFDGVSIEEIASAAEVSKPVIYEHFGGKEGLYQVIVDRDTTTINQLLGEALDGQRSPRLTLEAAILGLLDYIEANPEGFGMLVHQSPEVLAGGEFSTIISDIGDHLTELLGAYFQQLGFDLDTAPIYAQMLSGLVGNWGQRWAINQTPPKEETAALLVNLMWNGLRGLERDPKLESREA